MRDGSVAETWTDTIEGHWIADHSEDWGRPVLGDGRVGFGVARGFAVVRDWRSDAGGTPTTKSLTNLQNLEFHNVRRGYARVVVHPSRMNFAITVRSG